MNEKSPAIQIFPNPISSEFNLTSDETISKVEIINLQGQAVTTETVNDKFVKIQNITLPSGFYFVRAYLTNGNVWTGKMLKD